MRFGVNYIPSREWQHSWLDFDENSLRADLEAIKSIGLDHIRANLLWNYFQLDPKRMSPLAMRNLEKFVAVCEEVGMDFFMSLFTGWMSGFYYFPYYMNTQHGLRMFSDESTYAEQQFYIREIGRVVAKSEWFLGFDLGNELSMVTILDKNCTIESADRWQAVMLATCEEVAPGKMHHNGVDHQPWFDPNKQNRPAAFSREGLSNIGAISPLHCYAEFTGCRAHSGMFGPHSNHLIDYMTQLVLAYAEDADRPVWIQEINSCPEIDTPTAVRFAEETLQTVTSLPNMWGITWWGSHDISREFGAFQELEYELGIFDVHNNLKPVGQTIKDFIKTYKENPVAVLPREVALVYDPSKDADDPWAQMDAFIALAQKGTPVALILPEKADDLAYLSKRGIKKVLR